MATLPSEGHIDTGKLQMFNLLMTVTPVTRAIDVSMDEGLVFEFVQDIDHSGFCTDKLVDNVFMAQQIFKSSCSQVLGNLAAHTAGAILVRHIKEIRRSLPEVDWAKHNRTGIFVPPMAV